MHDGQFPGIGADEAQVRVKVEKIQPMGLLISTKKTNAQTLCPDTNLVVAVVFIDSSNASR
jgi:hypothetical protein